MSEPHWLVRAVEAYDKVSEEWCNEQILRSIPLAVLQALWRTDSGDPMVDVYDVSPEQAVALRPYLDAELDLVLYDYQLAAYTTDFDKSVSEGGYMGKFPPPKDLPAFPDAHRAKAKTPLTPED